MADFMSSYLNYSVQQPALKVALRLVVFICPLWHEPMQTLNPTKRRYAIPKAKTTEIICIQINICKTDNTYCIAPAILDRPDNMSQNMNSIILSVSVDIFLCFNFLIAV